MAGFAINGEIRTRYEGLDFDGVDEPDKKQRNRGRVRVRLGIEKHWGNGLEAGVRLATGALDGSISTNQSFGGGMINKSFNLDRAYISYTPEAGSSLSPAGWPTRSSAPTWSGTAS
jgi:hypothetical protein